MLWPTGAIISSMFLCKFGCGGEDSNFRSPAYEASEMTTSLPRNNDGAPGGTRTLSAIFGAAGQTRTDTSYDTSF